MAWLEGVNLFPPMPPEGAVFEHPFKTVDYFVRDGKYGPGSFSAKSLPAQTREQVDEDIEKHANNSKIVLPDTAKICDYCLQDTSAATALVCPFCSVSVDMCPACVESRRIFHRLCTIEDAFPVCCRCRFYSADRTKFRTYSSLEASEPHVEFIVCTRCAEYIERHKSSNAEKEDTNQPEIPEEDTESNSEKSSTNET